MRRLTLLIVALCVVGMQVILAQSPKKVTGVVKDKDGYGMPGVTVIQKGISTNGTITDIDGNYTINVPEGAIIVFSFIGYFQAEQLVGAANSYDITMNEEIKEIDEVVVRAYGTRKKIDDISVHTTVKSEAITQVPTTSLTNALQGLAAGVNVDAGDGTPTSVPSINIRGQHSINASTGPLWVIDGVPMFDAQNMINPNDIESIEFLKDAKATAVYGSRASSGVIMVTTKSGMGKSKTTNINITQGLSYMGKNPDKMGYANTEEYFKIVEKAAANSGFDSGYFQPSKVTDFFKNDQDYPIDTIGYNRAKQTNTDWYDEILRTGKFVDLNFSTNGGFEKGAYYVSANYKNTNGVILNNDQTQMATRVNLDYELFKNLKMGTKSSFNYRKYSNPKGGGGWSGPFGLANRESLSWFPIYDENSSTGYWNSMSGYNLKAISDKSLYDSYGDSYRGMGSTYLQYDLPWTWAKGIYIRSDAGFDVMQNSSFSLETRPIRKFASAASDNSSTNRILNYSFYANMNKDLVKNINLDLTIGNDNQRDVYWNRNMSAEGITTSYHQLGNSTSPVETKKDMFSYLSYEHYLKSFFYRSDWKFFDRYYFSFDIRTDGSSKFKDDNKWGTFYAYSFGWIASKERFFPFNVKKFNLLKFRFSSGQVGNNAIGSNYFENQYSNSIGNAYPDDALIPGGTQLSLIGNRSLKWETTTSTDVGFDYAFLSNKIEGSFTFYRQNITDLLFYSPLPPSSPVGGYWDNIGDMRNWGYEFDIKTVNFDNLFSKFKWTTDFNITWNQNKITKLIDGIDRTTNGNSITMVGEEKGTYFISEWAGVDPTYGVDMIQDIDLDKWENEHIIEKLGKKIPATKTNLENNRVIHHGKSSNPKYWGGLNNRFEYRNLDLSFRFIFSGLNYIYDYLQSRTTNVGNATFNLKKELLTETWTPENPNAKYPELRYNYVNSWNMDSAYNWYVDTKANYNNIDGNTSSTRYLVRGDYIRLKTIEIGYSFPQPFVNKLKLKQLRCAFNMTNLFVISPYYKQWDPETNEGSLPPTRNFNFSLNVTF